MRKILVVGLMVVIFTSFFSFAVFSRDDENPDPQPTPPPGGGGTPARCGMSYECAGCDYVVGYCCERYYGDGTCNFEKPICCEDYVWCDESKIMEEKCRDDLNCCNNGQCFISGLLIDCSYLEIGFTGIGFGLTLGTGIDNGCGNSWDINNHMWINNCGTTYPAWFKLEDGMSKCQSLVTQNGGSCYGPAEKVKYYNMCNDNSSGEEGSFDFVNPFPNLQPCISFSYPEESLLPECLINRTCWLTPQECAINCNKYFFCEEEEGTCTYGFFRSKADCDSKHPRGCFINEGTCFEACKCLTTNDCGAVTCIGEYCENGCGGFEAGRLDCNPKLVQPPGLGVGTPGGLIINPDESGRNHICEMDASGEERFFVSNTVRFSFVLDGWSEDESKMGVVGIGFNNNDDDNVLTMTMALFGGSPSEAFPPTGTSAGYVLGTAGTRLLPEIEREFFFDITFLDGFDDNLNFAWVSAVTGNGTTLPWTFTGRSFKVWDCKVPVSGAMYDGTVEEGGDVCIDGFSEKVEADFYDSLTFRRLGNNPEDFEMTVNSPDYESDGNSLDWGFSYNHLFGNLDGDSENILLKVTDVGGSSSCDALLNLGTRVDPYSTLPSAVVDFALAVNPDPWFQSIDGGVQAGGNFTNTVPVTCASNPDCVEASVISGLLAAGGSMNKGCSDCSFASPDTWVNKNMVTGSFAYQYFYNEYFAKLGQGTTMSGESTMTDLGEEAKGIYFIDGDFFVDKNNTLTTASSDYLIIIAKGRIIFEEDVDVSSGIFIADGDIEARGEGSSNLTIEGMLFSTNGNVRLSRGYINRSMNRSNPGVLVLFRPDYLFKLPGEITRVLSGWRER